MTGAQRPWWRPRLDGLAPRVAAYLSVALLPLGLIALYQTREFQDETEERAELSLLALTVQGAAPLRQAVEQAIGAGEALGRVAPLLADPETCAAALGSLAGEGAPYDYIGLVPAEGRVECASSPERHRVGDRETWAELLAGGAAARSVSVAEGSDDRWIIVGVPLPEAAEPAEGEAPRQRFIALSVPRSDLGIDLPEDPGLRPLRLVTFNAAGQILTSRNGTQGAPPLADLLPSDRTLAGEAQGGARQFGGVSGLGTEQVYTVAPVVPGVAWSLAVWSPEQAGLWGRGPRESPLLFPLLMWASSLAVGFWAIHRLVIRRVTELGARMRRFGLDRSLPPPRLAAGTPHELREIDLAFRQMAEAILQDEARMENAFRERGVLLREVHHRVKNNLQLISSIISMQMRRMRDPQIRGILLRLQDRVLTLASIYRSLYTSPDLSDVNAAPVLRAIVEQGLRGAQERVEVTLDIEDMVLDADQVVPLSFLAAEAVSNALARAAAPPGVRPSVSVTLHRDGNRARLEIANSLSGGELVAEDPARGLGQHLIHAFAAQMGGPVESQSDDRLYRLSVAFPVEPARLEVEPA